MDALYLTQTAIGLKLLRSYSMHGYRLFCIC